ncbi:MAG: c-type cytochrome [Phenylobacterium sp.]
MSMILIGGAALALLAPSAQPPQVASGARIAETRCAVCHAIGLKSESPKVGAPSFDEIRLEYNEPSLERKLLHIAKHGHRSMKPLAISPHEAADIAAYVESLRPQGYP